MVKISNFSVNSDFPTIAKSTEVESTTMNIPATTIQPASSQLYTQNITISSGDIISVVISVNNKNIASSWFAWGDYAGVSYYAMASQISPTVVQVRVYISNGYIYQAQTTSAFSVVVKVKAFRVP